MSVYQCDPSLKQEYAFNVKCKPRKPLFVDVFMYNARILCITPQTLYITLKGTFVKAGILTFLTGIGKTAVCCDIHRKSPIYSDKLAHVQVVLISRTLDAQMCTREDELAYILGALSISDVMSYSLLTTLC